MWFLAPAKTNIDAKFTVQADSISAKSSMEELPKVRLTWRTWLAVFITCIPILAQTFVTTAAGSVIAFIVRDLGNASLASWVIQGPLLMQSVLSPLVGRLSDVLDRKWLVTLPPLVALAGAVVSAKATSIAMLIAGGILIGCTLSTGSIVQSIPSEVLPLKYRALANGITFWAAGLGGISGTLGAGAVTNASPSGWRTLFWIQVGLHGLSFLGLLLFYHPKRHSDYPRLPVKQFLWTLDPIGSVLFASSTTLILLALDWTGGSYAWSDAHVIAPLVIGFVLLIFFAFYEWLGRDDGLVPHMFFRGSPNIALALFIFGIEGWLFYSAINSVIPQIVLNLGFEDNSWSISVRQLSTTITTLFSCLVVTWYATKTKDLRTPLAVTWVVFLAVTIAYCFISPTQDAAQIVYSVLLAIGQSGPLTLVVAVLQLCSPHEYLSTATGLAFSARAVGGAFGSAVLTAIINGKLGSTYANKVGEAATATGLPASSVEALVTAFLSGNMQAIGSVPGMNPAIFTAATNASHWAYARAYRLAWASVVPFVVIALIAIFCLKDVKALMTDKIEATVEPSSKTAQEKEVVDTNSNSIPSQTMEQV